VRGCAVVMCAFFWCFLHLLHQISCFVQLCSYHLCDCCFVHESTIKSPNMQREKHNTYISSFFFMYLYCVLQGKVHIFTTIKRDGPIKSTALLFITIITDFKANDLDHLLSYNNHSIQYAAVSQPT